MTIDPAAAIEAARALKLLHDRAGEVIAALDAVEAAPTHEARRKQAFDLALRFGGVRAVGYIAQWSAEERHDWLQTLLSDEAVRDFAQSLLERVGRPATRRALSAAMPGSFPPPDAATWAAYRGRLRAKPDEKIWGDPEGVVLRGLWVLPAATRREAEASDERSPRAALAPKTRAPEEPVDDVLASVEALLVAPHAPGMTFVTGPAGLGKSTFAVMLADRLATRTDVSPVFARLRDVAPDRPLMEELERVLDAEGFRFGEGLSAAPRLVLVLDGFDELGDSARAATGMSFVRVRELVRDGHVHAALLTGRDTLLHTHDGSYPTGADVFTLQPFDAPRVQRWCERWQESTGHAFDASRLLTSGEPDDSLRDVASHPLMLYMLARMEASGAPIATESFDDRARVYQTIIRWCCERHETLRPHDRWKATHMRRFLRAAGYAAMVRGRDALRLDDVKDAVRALGLETGDDPARFAAEHAILAFTHRGAADQTWEFTHRSFGEFLAAEQLAGACLGVIERARNPLDPQEEETWRLDAGAATREWIEAFGTALMSENVERFLVWMLRGSGVKTLATLRERLGVVYRELIEETEAEHALRVARGWKIAPSSVLGVALANLFMLGGAEERFLPERAHGGHFPKAVHSIRAVLDDPGGQRIYRHVGLQGIENRHVRNVTGWIGVMLLGIDASGCDLSGIDLRFANLSSSNLRDCNLTDANLGFTSVGFADFGNANLRNTNMAGALILRCNLCRVDLHGADANFSQFIEVDTRDAQLPEGIKTSASVFTHPPPPAPPPKPRPRKR